MDIEHKESMEESPKSSNIFPEYEDNRSPGESGSPPRTCDLEYLKSRIIDSSGLIKMYMDSEASNTLLKSSNSKLQAQIIEYRSLHPVDINLKQIDTLREKVGDWECKYLALEKTNQQLDAKCKQLLDQGGIIKELRAVIKERDAGIREYSSIAREKEGERLLFINDNNRLRQTNITLTNEINKYKSEQIVQEREIERYKLQLQNLNKKDRPNTEPQISATIQNKAITEISPINSEKIEIDILCRYIIELEKRLNIKENGNNIYMKNRGIENYIRDIVKSEISTLERGIVKDSRRIGEESDGDEIMNDKSSGSLMGEEDPLDLFNNPQLTKEQLNPTKKTIKNIKRSKIFVSPESTERDQGENVNMNIQIGSESDSQSESCSEDGEHIQSKKKLEINEHDTEKANNSSEEETKQMNDDEFSKILDLYGHEIEREKFMKNKKTKQKLKYDRNSLKKAPKQKIPLKIPKKKERTSVGVKVQAIGNRILTRSMKNAMKDKIDEPDAKKALRSLILSYSEDNNLNIKILRECCNEYKDYTAKLISFLPEILIENNGQCELVSTLCNSLIFLKIVMELKSEENESGRESTEIIEVLYSVMESIPVDLKFPTITLEKCSDPLFQSIYTLPISCLQLILPEMTKLGTFILILCIVLCRQNDNINFAFQIFYTEARESIKCIGGEDTLSIINKLLALLASYPNLLRSEEYHIYTGPIHIEEFKANKCGEFTINACRYTIYHLIYTYNKDIMNILGNFGFLYFPEILIDQGDWGEVQSIELVGKVKMAAQSERVFDAYEYVSLEFELPFMDIYTAVDILSLGFGPLWTYNYLYLPLIWPMWSEPILASNTRRRAVLLIGLIGKNVRIRDPDGKEAFSKEYVARRRSIMTDRSGKLTIHDKAICAYSLLSGKPSGDDINVIARWYTHLTPDEKEYLPHSLYRGCLHLISQK